MLNLENYTVKDGNAEPPGKEAGFAAELLHSAAYSATAPIQSIRELIGGSEKAAPLVEKPQPAEFLSARWQAQQIGSTVGMIPWLVATDGALRGAAKVTLPTWAAGTESVIRPFMTGAIYGGLLTPDDPLSYRDNRVSRAIRSSWDFGAWQSSMKFCQSQGINKGLGSMIAAVPIGAVDGFIYGVQKSNFPTFQYVKESIAQHAYSGALFGMAAMAGERLTARIGLPYFSSASRDLFVQPSTAMDRKTQFLNDIGVTAEFKSKVEGGINSIPLSVRVALEHGGFSIVLAPRVQDYDNLPGTPRGYPEGTGSASIPAVLDGTALVVGQRYYNYFAKQDMEHYTADQAVRHEAGHALDRLWGGSLLEFSTTAEFVKAYNEDVTNIPPYMRATFEYYLQPGDAGRSETMAEICATLFGAWRTDMRRYFPKTCALVQKKLDEFEESYGKRIKKSAG